MYRLAKSHSNRMAKAGRLFHSGRYALQGGENICGGRGHHTPKGFVTSWMKSSGHRAWLLDARVKTAAVGISQSKYGTYAAWSFSDQPLIQWRPIKGVSGWLHKLFHTTHRRWSWRPYRRKTRTLMWTSEKPGVLSWLARVFGWVTQLLSASLVVLGVHGLWVYFSHTGAPFGEDTTRLFLAVRMPPQLQSLVEWMSLKGMQTWFFPAVIVVAGIILWHWLVPILQRRT